MFGIRLMLKKIRQRRKQLEEMQKAQRFESFN